MATRRIKHQDIPLCLQEGQFYRNLDASDPEDEVEIPVNCFAWTLAEHPADVHEFCKLLRIMAFWALDKYPSGILSFCSKNKVSLWHNSDLDLPDNIVMVLVCAYSSRDALPLHHLIRYNCWQVTEHALKWAHKRSSATLVAADVGDVDLLQFLHEEGFDWHKDTCALASKSGHLECLMFAHQNGCPCDSSALLFAAQNGHLHCMQYLHGIGVEWHTQVCEYATLGNHIHCLEFALNNGCLFDDLICNIACRNGHIECLKLLHHFGAHWDAKTCASAAKCSDISCLKYLREHGCPWNEETPPGAAEKGNIDTLRYAMHHGCPYWDCIVSHTAAQGQLSCLQYLVEELGILMNSGAFFGALLSGNLACLRYLIDQGCPFADFPVNTAAFDGLFQRQNPEFVHCIEFAVERGWKPNIILLRYVTRTNDRTAAKVVLQEYQRVHKFEKWHWLYTSLRLLNNTSIIGRIIVNEAWKLLLPYLIYYLYRLLVVGILILTLFCCKHSSALCGNRPNHILLNNLSYVADLLL